MDRSTIISELEEFKKLVTLYEKALDDYEQAENRLVEAQNFEPRRLIEFDEKYFPEFVESKIGKKKEPKKFGYFNPLKYSKKAVASKKLKIDNHNKIMSNLKSNFDLQYEKKRESFKKADDEEKEEKIQQAENEFSLKEEIFKARMEKVESVNLLPKKMISSVVVDQLINYFADWRVDTVREAINLYFEESWRKKESKKTQELFKRVEDKLNKNNSMVTKALEDISSILDSISELENTLDDVSSKID